MPREENAARPAAEGDADLPTTVDRLAEAIAGRIAESVLMRGVPDSERLRQAVRRKARQVAEVALADAPPAHPIDDGEIAEVARACASILCDLPTANLMEVLLPDPHLAPLNEALAAIGSAAEDGDLGTWSPRHIDAGTPCTAGRQAVLDAITHAAGHWDALSPHGRVLAKVDRDAVRRGLISSLGFEGFLDAERRLGGVLAPRQPYRAADE